jgi:hypothetical protein
MKNRLVFTICLVGCILFTLTVALPAVVRLVEAVNSGHVFSP